ncbi:hypothetical protein QZM89_06605 [Burkholderia gladioli]|uniref:hypothetical protein n=1 Tax=Burkholderia gladioli TaxID=28095 RepID=UPI0026513FC1|nr:hypothetical protein [Burkholderia gladioli]MDN7494849.1 hypothetical protein [Burkholderia gladioli]
MPKITAQFRAKVLDATSVANRITCAANEFCNVLQSLMDQPAVAKLNVVWNRQESLSRPAFAFDSSVGTIVAGFDHVMDGGYLRGRYRLYRYVGSPIAPVLKEFWSFMIAENGAATWTIPGGLEWNSQDKADVMDFIHRAMAEFFSTMDQVQ